jgi:hypothetical protein
MTSLRRKPKEEETSPFFTLTSSFSVRLRLVIVVPQPDVG